MRRVLLAALALLAAGCTQPALGTFRARGEGPVAFLGYDYAAGSAQPGEGLITLEVDPAADTGSAVATFTALGRAWRAEFTRFFESRPFHEGGVRSGFPEHGPSGNGDALLPLIHALSAGWGAGTVSADGQPFTDPVTGNTTFSLHYMVTDTAPRDPATFRITKANGEQNYDPGTPADARVHNGTHQILLNVQSPAVPPQDGQYLYSDTVTAPNYTVTQAFEVNATTATVTLNFTVTNPTALPTAGQLSFVVSDPAGQEVGRWEYDPVSTGAAGRGTGSVVLPPPVAPGAYALRIEGSGANVLYNAIVTVDYPDAVFFHVVYTRVLVG